VSLIEGVRRRGPVIGTRVGGVPDIITPGVNGLLVPSGDVAACGGHQGPDCGSSPPRSHGRGGRRAWCLERHNPTAW